jgi:hypothetical protein
MKSVRYQFQVSEGDDEAGCKISAEVWKDGICGRTMVLCQYT